MFYKIVPALHKLVYRRIGNSRESVKHSVAKQSDGRKPVQWPEARRALRIRRSDPAVGPRETGGKFLTLDNPAVDKPADCGACPAFEQEGKVALLGRREVREDASNRPISSFVVVELERLQGLNAEPESGRPGLQSVYQEHQRISHPFDLRVWPEHGKVDLAGPKRHNVGAITKANRDAVFADAEVVEQLLLLELAEYLVTAFEKPECWPPANRKTTSPHVHASQRTGRWRLGRPALARVVSLASHGPAIIRQSLSRRPRTLAEFAAFKLWQASGAGGPIAQVKATVKAAQAVTFLWSWAYTTRKLDRPPTRLEHGAEWKQSEREVYRDLALFRQAFPTEANPDRLAGWMNQRSEALIAQAADALKLLVPAFLLREPASVMEGGHGNPARI